MATPIKNREDILAKLGIEELNDMQKEAHAAIYKSSDVVLLSPTGTGKTLAFLLPVIDEMNPDETDVQVLILVPSRELAIQIESVIREMGTGYKCNAVYGGQSFNQDRINLKHPPAIIVGTPGRVADHMRRGIFNTSQIKTLILDEYDKALEVGFEDEMDEICSNLKYISKRILTSATKETQIPPFVGLRTPTVIDYSSKGVPKLAIKTIISPTKDKLDTLVKTLCHLGNQPGIIFCNFKDSIQRVSEFLEEKGIPHGCFYGGMEQLDRENALIKFRNGTHQLILATDLAARGLDVPEIKFIIHYHMPMKAHEFTHRNGRTARMKSDGTAYVLQSEGETLPEYFKVKEIETLVDAPLPVASKWKTIYITGGRRDKISKGDIAGLCFKQGGLTKDQLGVIEIKQDNAYFAVDKAIALDLVRAIDGTRLKKAKLRVSIT
jgi:superfamily II DNA/RNA helicase